MELNKMTVQDKMSKLPLTIESNGLMYELDIYNNREKWYLCYEAYIPESKRIDDRVYDRIFSCEATEGSFAENFEAIIVKAMEFVKDYE